MASDGHQSGGRGGVDPARPLRRLAGELPDEIEQYLAASAGRRATGRVVPWVASFMGHLGLIVLGFFITWSVVNLGGEDEPALIVADFHATTYDPVTPLDVEVAETTVEPLQDVEFIDTPPDVSEVLAEILEPEPVEVISTATGSLALPEFSPRVETASAELFGLTSTNARRIVYVIDASGSMITTFPIVIAELATSLRGLNEQQSFAVLFFQKREAIAVPPGDRLVVASEAEKARSLQWIRDEVIAQRESSPLAALEQALNLRPDVIFLLSTNITGSGQFEIDQGELMQFLDARNPKVGSRGLRRTTINCIQFLEDDPLGTMRKIADRHGGPRGYTFLDRRALGLDG